MNSIISELLQIIKAAIAKKGTEGKSKSLAVVLIDRQQTASCICSAIITSHSCMFSGYYQFTTCLMYAKLTKSFNLVEE